MAREVHCFECGRVLQLDRQGEPLLFEGNPLRQHTIRYATNQDWRDLYYCTNDPYDVRHATIA